MILGGFQKNSLIDYPAKVSCIIFLSGCNFSCPYCHNPGLARGNQAIPSFLDKNFIYDFLIKRKGLLDGVVISGGEPTLQNDIFSLCEKIKKIGYPIKLDTNGSRPNVVKALIDDGLVDYIAMDIKTDPAGYAPVISNNCESQRICSTIDIIMASSLKYEFRTTCIKPFVNSDTIHRMLQYIKGADLYILQRFNHAEVLNPEFIETNECVVTDKELAGFQTIAEDLVGSCLIR